MEDELKDELESQSVIQHNEGFNERLIVYRSMTILDLCKGPKVLELGCGDGLITKELAKLFNKIVAVDGSMTRISRARKHVGRYVEKVEFDSSLMEDFETRETFDSIILSGILEHLIDPFAILRRIKRWLKRDGYIIIVVPNARSVHRRIGMRMGLIANLYELTEQDISVGHKRYYDSDVLKEHIAESGL